MSLPRRAIAAQAAASTPSVSRLWILTEGRAESAGGHPLRREQRNGEQGTGAGTEQRPWYRCDNALGECPPPQTGVRPMLSQPPGQNASRHNRLMHETGPALPRSATTRGKQRSFRRQTLHGGMVYIHTFFATASSAFGRFSAFRYWTPGAPATGWDARSIA